MAAARVICERRDAVMKCTLALTLNGNTGDRNVGGSNRKTSGNRKRKKKNVSIRLATINNAEERTPATATLNRKYSQAAISHTARRTFVDADCGTKSEGCRAVKLSRVLVATAAVVIGLCKNAVHADSLP